MRGDGASKLGLGLWALATAALVALAMIRYLLISQGTALLSPDSVSYISVARNLLTGHGLVLFDGSPLYLWPPGYPTALATVGLLGSDPLTLAGPLNATILALIALAGGIWVRWRIRNAIAGAVATIAILVSRPLWSVSIFALSEPLFALLALWSLIALQRYLDDGRSRTLVAASLLSALAVLTRNLGVLLLLAGVMTVLLRRGVNLKRRVADALIYGSLPVVAFGAWSMWVSVVAGDLVGERALADVSLGQNLFLLADTLAAWGLPWSVDTYPKLLILAVIAAGVTGALLWKNASQTEEADRSSMGADSFGWFVIVYSIGIVGVLSILHADRLGERLLSPVWAPLAIWILTWVWNRLHTMAGSARRRLSAGVLMILLAFWLGRSAIVTRGFVEHAEMFPTGFTGNRWTESKTIAYLKEHPPETVLYSNVPYPIYIYTSLRVHRSPRRYWFGAPDRPTRDLADFHDALADEDEITLAWFDQDPSTYQFSPEDLRDHFRVEPITELSDGTLYRVTGRERDSAVDPATNP